MVEKSLTQQLANKEYVGWKPDSSEWLHALAVIGNDKPAALVSVFDDELDRIQELVVLAQKNGCKTLIHCEPELAAAGDQSYLAFHKTLLVYRDEDVRKQYVQIKHDHLLGAVDIDNYTHRLGKVLGYRDTDIEAYIRNNPPEVDHRPRGPDIIAYIKNEAPPAVYDMLSKDPVLSDILPQRQVSQIKKD